jgi:hypothetical protein
MDNQEISPEDSKKVNDGENHVEECSDEEYEEEEEKENNNPDLGNILNNLDQLFKGNDNLFKNIDMTEMQNNMNMMMNKLQNSGDPNILSMLNLMNNLSISNLTNSQFGLGDNEQNDISNEKLVDGNSDTSDEEYEMEQENEKSEKSEESDESEESDLDEDLLSYLKDKEENQDMILNVKKMLENMNRSND